jgi:hypothetical protein
MSRKKTLLLFYTGLIVLIFMISRIPPSSDINYDDKLKEYPHISASLEGAENILVTNINREAELNGYGLLNIHDEITIQNFNNYPISSIFIGIPLAHSKDLIFFEAKGKDDNSFSSERSDYIIKDFELIAIYFDSPLNPEQSLDIIFIHSYKDMLGYTR